MTGMKTLTALALAAGLAFSAPSQAQQVMPNEELFRAPADSSDLIKSWDGHPYVDVVAACAGITEAYRQAATQIGNERAEKGGTMLLQQLRRVLTARLRAMNVPLNVVPPIVDQQWKNGLTIAQNAFKRDQNGGMQLVENTTRECLNAVMDQERTQGRIN